MPSKLPYHLRKKNGYFSGLRLLFSQNRKLGGKEHVVVRNVNAVVREIFHVTGFERQITLE